MSDEKIRAVAMISGGLDSSLAVKIVADQGIDVIGVNYSTGFCLTDHHRKMVGMGADITPKSVRNEALQAGARWRIPVEIIDISKEYMDILTNPRYGYGKNVNPCIDCRIFMQKKTLEYMDKVGARFIITGEVLGQRPMSQMKQSMHLIEMRSGAEGKVLRPLSAKLLKPTIAETEGWVDRSKLYDFKGRSRKPQMELAQEIGLAEYPQPAGGCCFLTDPNYARRMQDLFDHQDKKTLTTEQVMLLKVGRHFRIGDRSKAVVGRNEAENLLMESQAGDRMRFNCTDVVGPLTLLEGDIGDLAVETAASLTARYGDGKNRELVDVTIETPGGGERVVSVKPMDEEECARIRI
jgi:tRNA-uridine 2-sulfurtransferase